MAKKSSTKKLAKAKSPKEKAPEDAPKPEVEPEVQPERANAAPETLEDTKEIVGGMVDEAGDASPSLESLLRVIIKAVEAHPDKSSVPRAQAIGHLKDALKAIKKL